MKKSACLLLTAYLPLLSCTNDNPDTPTPAEKYTPVIEFEYSQGGVTKTDMTMVLSIDGKEYKFDKDSDRQTVKLSATSGTVKLDCKVDGTKTYTEKQDASVSVFVCASSITEDGKSYASIKEIVGNKASLKGIKADKVTEALNTFAEALNTSVTYTVDSKGIVSIK